MDSMIKAETLWIYKFVFSKRFTGFIPYFLL